MTGGIKHCLPGLSPLKKQGSEVIINGSGFLDTPGQVEIMVGTKKVPIIPMGKDWWSNYAIRFKVGNIPGQLSREVGILTIRTAAGQVIANSADFLFVYGPEMTVKVVSALVERNSKGISPNSLFNGFALTLILIRTKFRSS